MDNPLNLNAYLGRGLEILAAINADEFPHNCAGEWAVNHARSAWPYERNLRVLLLAGAQFDIGKALKRAQDLAKG